MGETGVIITSIWYIVSNRTTKNYFEQDLAFRQLEYLKHAREILYSSEYGKEILECIKNSDHKPVLESNNGKVTERELENYLHPKAIRRCLPNFEWEEELFGDYQDVKTILENELKKADILMSYSETIKEMFKRMSFEEFNEAQSIVLEEGNVVKDIDEFVKEFIEDKNIE